MGAAKPRIRWKEAVTRFITEAQIDKKASIKNDQDALRWLDDYFQDHGLHGIYLDEFTPKLVSEIITARRTPYVLIYPSGQTRRCEPGPDTVNRFLTTLRAMLIKSRDEWDWVDKIPKIPALPNTTERIRWITKQEAEALVYELPAHLASMCEFSLQTGLRRANVTHLKWSQVDLPRRTAWVLSEDTKNGKSLGVPLSAQAVKILEKQKNSQIKKPSEWVFPRSGKPVHQTSTKAWRDALKRAGIEDFCWHDLRHTWASWHVQSGTPLHVLQELGGWSSIKMVQKYAHLSSEHLRAWVDKSPGVRLVVDNDNTGTKG
ncbi:MAG: site-specific integrase [Xanthomonadales bacterium]|nr:site-specific integrase [Xanthomonadales bacterium]